MRKALLVTLSVVACLITVPAGRAGTAIKLGIEGLVDRSELVFEGRVLTATPMSTPEGRVETEYLVTVTSSFWGPPQGTQTFRLPGGVLPSGIGMVLPGMPTVQVGDDAIFFLTEQSPSGIRMPVGLAQGKLDLATGPQGQRLLVGANQGLSLVNPETGAVQPASKTVLDYGFAVQAIQAAAQEREAREAKAKQLPVNGEGQ